MERGSNGCSDFDVVIVGAGPGGLGAARALPPATRSVLLEARDRVGGRVYTNPHLARPFDYGAQYFDMVIPTKDGDGTANPLYDLAIARGVRVVPEGKDSSLLHEGIPASEEDIAAVGANLFLMDEAIKAVGGPAAASGTGDVSCAEAVAPLAGSPLLAAATAILVNQRGIMERMSAADYYNQNSLMEAPIGVPSNDTFLIPDGYGTFLATLADGLDVRLSTPVTAIDATHAHHVRLSTRSGEVTAKHVILAVPLGVLTAGTIQFTPPLPNHVLSGLDDLPMALVDKVGIEFSSHVFESFQDNSMIGQFVDSETAPSFITKFMGADMASMMIGGLLALDLEAEGLPAIEAYAREAVRATFGAATEQAIEKIVCNPWGTDPWAKGSWTMARPGGAAARERLTAPIHDRIFLAGEPFLRQMYGTAHGAYISGQNAARAISALQ